MDIRANLLSAAIEYYKGDRELNAAVGNTKCFEDLVNTVSNSDFRERSAKWESELEKAKKYLSDDEVMEVIMEAFKELEKMKENEK